MTQKAPTEGTLSVQDIGLALPHARTLVVRRLDGGDGVLEVRAPDGRIEVSVELGPSGPRLRISAADLDIEALGTVRVACADLELRASRTASLVAENGLRLESAKGSVALQAHDDLDLDGERILLNSDVQPMALSWEEHEAREKARKPGKPSHEG